MIFFKNTQVITKIATATFMLGLFTMAGFYACKKPTDGINLKVNTTSLSQSPTLLVFSNANINGTALADFDVTITGSGAQYVRTDGGGTKFKVSGGMLSLNLNKDVLPSTANPVTFNVYAEAPGFSPVVTTVTITDNNPHVKLISLIEFAHLPAGTASVSNTTNLNGGTSAAVNFNVPTNASVTAAATLSIPAGTQMLDANGTLINANSLTTTILQYSGNSPLNPSAGKQLDNVLGTDGKPVSGGVYSISAGLMSINMQAGSVAVKSFSKPLKLTMEIPDGMINATGSPVKAGDNLQIMSMNEATGQWKIEGNAVVALDGNNKFAVTINVTHLSHWGAALEVAEIAHTVDINFIPANRPFYGEYNIRFESSDGTAFNSNDYSPAYDHYVSTTISGKNRQVIDQSKYGVRLTTVPNLKSPFTISLYQNGWFQINPTPIASANNIDITTASVINLPINNSKYDTVGVTINITGKCNGKNVVVLPQLWVTIKDKDQSATYLGYQSFVHFGGAPTYVTLVNNHHYTFTTTFNGNTYSGDFQLGGGVLSYIPRPNDDIGLNDLVGTGVLVPGSTTKSTFTGEIRMSCN